MRKVSKPTGLRDCLADFHGLVDRLQERGRRSEMSGEPQTIVTTTRRWDEVTPNVFLGSRVVLV